MQADRALRVQPGWTVETGYVDVFRIRMACRDRMAVGDVGAAYHKALQLGNDEQFPCPTGEWDGDTFVLQDGRHHWISCLMLGKSHMLVSWLAPPRDR